MGIQNGTCLSARSRPWIIHAYQPRRTAPRVTNIAKSLTWPTLEDFLLFYGILCFHAFGGSGGVGKWPPYIWKPLICGYVAAGAFFFQKMAPIFMEALNLWVRCRRRFFFFRKMAPRFPDAAGAGGAAGGAGQILRSQLDPSPNAPRDQIRRKDPCCDLIIGSGLKWVGLHDI